MITDSGVHLFYNARAAMYQLARALRCTGRSTILLPAFHCPSVVEPVLRAGFKPAFYRVGRDLEIDPSDVLARMGGDVAAAVFVNFLGFPSAIEPLLPELRARGILAVEDCAHACVSVDPLEISGRRADAAIYSFWKLVPSGVGGGLWLSPDVRLELDALRPAPLSDSVVRAKRLFEETIMSLGEESAIARAYGLAERARVRAKTLLKRYIRPSVEPREPTVRPGPAQADEPAEYFFDERLAGSRLPWMSERIMARSDVAAIVNARRRNYSTLADALRPAPLVTSMRPSLPRRISPLAYPVWVPDRASHDVLLRARGVPVWTFGSKLHRVLFEMGDASVVNDARQLSDNVLLIPVHHMLSAADMMSFAETIDRYSKELAPCAST